MRRLLVAIVALLAVGATVALSAATRTATRTLTLGTLRSSFVDTHVDIPKGTSASITATGDGTCHEGGASDCAIGPNGSGFKCSANPVGGPTPPGPAGDDVPYGTIAGRVGHGKPFKVGAGKTVRGPGELYLLYNDCDAPAGYGDNAGSFKVKITYQTADRMIEGDVVSQCSDSCGERLPISDVTVRVRGKQDYTATTDAKGHYSVAVKKGKYSVEPSNSGFVYTPQARKVKVAGADEKGVDFTGCGADASSARVARAGAVSLHNSKTSCLNRITFTYDPAIPRASVTWASRLECSNGGAYGISATGGFTPLIRRNVGANPADLLTINANGSMVVNLADPAGNLEMHFVIAPSGQTGRVDVSNGSPEVSRNDGQCRPNGRKNIPLTH